MHRRIVVTLAVLAISVSGLAGCKKKESPQTTEAPVTTTAPAAPAPAGPPSADTGLTGEQLFKQYCAACHPDGGNTVNPNKTIKAQDLAARSNITKPEDIVKVMRNPGPGMNKIDEATLSDKDARKIGEYVLATFK